MKLDDTMLSKINQTEKEKYCVTHLYVESKNKIKQSKAKQSRSELTMLALAQKLVVVHPFIQWIEIHLTHLLPFRFSVTAICLSYS
jgi:hypothetical protein